MAGKQFVQFITKAWTYRVPTEQDLAPAEVPRVPAYVAVGGESFPASLTLQEAPAHPPPLLLLS